MLPEDVKRLQREADIAKAKLGPDYSRLEKEISNAKSEEAQNKRAGRLETATRARIAALAKMAENIVVPTGAPVEHDKSQSQDQGQER